MRKVSFLLMGMLCLSLVSALDISEEHNTNIMVQGINTPIELTLKITNASLGNYNVYTLSGVSITPAETFKITNGSTEKNFTINPTENLNTQGYYLFTYTLNHRNVEKIEKKFTINILNLEDILEISSDSINPESSEVSFYIKNNENVNLENISATFSSVLTLTSFIFKFFSLSSSPVIIPKALQKAYLLEKVEAAATT